MIECKLRRTGLFAWDREASNLTRVDCNGNSKLCWKWQLKFNERQMGLN